MPQSIRVILLLFCLIPNISWGSKSERTQCLSAVLVDGVGRSLAEDTIALFASQNLTFILAHPTQAGVLVNLDSRDTIKVKKDTASVVEYGMIETGEYDFRSDGQSLIHLSITSSFFQNWWFVPAIILYLSILLGSAYFLVRLNNIRNRKKLHGLRLDWTNKLHSDMGADLNSISLNLQLIQRRWPAADEKVTKRFNRIASTLSNIEQQLRLLFNLVNPQRNSLEAALNDICQFAEQGASSINARFHLNNELTVEQQRAVDIGQINKLYLLLKEVINNSIKYSNAKRIRLNVKSFTNELLFEIIDDGVGFDLGQANGTGTQLLRQYAREGLMLLDIKSTLNEGTIVKIQVPKL